MRRTGKRRARSHAASRTVEFLRPEAPRAGTRGDGNAGCRGLPVSYAGCALRSRPRRRGAARLRIRRGWLVRRALLAADVAGFLVAFFVD